MTTCLHPSQFRTAAPRRVYSITLSDEQYGRAIQVASNIHDRCRASGMPDGHGATNGSITWDDEVGGHAGELAVALLLGVEWSGETAGPCGADVGARTQVRTLTRASSTHLLVRPHDLRKYGNVPYVLVRQHEDKKTFTIMGWCMADEVALLGRESDGGHRGRPPVYLVAPLALHHIRGINAP